jgi:hypothetical protein
MDNLYFNRESSVRALARDFYGPAPGASAYVEFYVDGVLSTDTPVQAQLLTKANWDDPDEPGDAVTINSDVTAGGIITRISATRLKLRFELNRVFTRRFTEARPYGVILWLTPVGATDPLTDVLRGGMYWPDQSISLDPGAILNVSTPASVVIDSPTAGNIVYYLADPIPLTAHALDDNGAPLPGVDFTWSSIDDVYGTVDAEGVFTPGEPGEVTVSATGRGVTGSIVLTISTEAIELDEGGDYVSVTEDGFPFINE